MKQLLFKFPNRTIYKKAFLYLELYSILFIVLSMVNFLPFLVDKKSLVWWGDGMDQHFPAFYYLGNYYRNIVKLVLNGSFFEIPMVDFNIGFGYDILTTLSYYGLGDPLVLLSAFAKGDNVELFYNAVIILRLYLIGVSFMIYCIYMRLDIPASVIGAIIYVFCGYSLYASIRHPFFSTPMLYLPLFLLLIERLITHEQGKGLLLSIMTALCAISNFYFFYMLTILGFIYGLVRYFDIHPVIHWKQVCKTFSRAIFYYMLGICLSMAYLLPVLLSYQYNARKSAFTLNVSWLYNWNYYVKVLFGLFSPAFMDDEWSILNLTPLALFGIIWLFHQRKKYRSYKIFLIIMVALLCFPLGGYIMNGFGYITNRWVWGLSFWFSIIVVLMYQESTPSKPSFLPLTAGILIVLTIVFFFSKPLQNINVLVGILSSITLLFLVLFFQKKGTTIWPYSIVLVFTSVALVFNAYFLYSPKHQNYVHQFIENQNVVPRIEDTAFALARTIEDDEFYRISGIKAQTSLNKALVMKYNGTTTYFSITDRRMADFCIDMELGALRSVYRMDGFDSRRALETLSSVKYYFIPEEYMSNVPFGFQEIRRDTYNGKNAIIFQNEYFLPLGYTYDHYINTEVFDQLTALQKQEAMFLGVVLSEIPALPIDEANLTEPDYGINYSVLENEDIVFDRDNSILYVKKDNAILDLSFEGTANSETYVGLHNFIIEKSDYESFALKAIDNDTGLQTEAYVTSRGYRLNSNTYSGIENYTFHLGYSSTSKTGCTIQFPKAGSFHLESLTVDCIPMDTYVKQIPLLKEDVLQNIQLAPNKVTGQIETQRDKMLCLTIPYSKGWTAIIDGAPAKVYLANGMYMALALEAGSHDIQLQYVTPGLKSGTWISLTAIGVCGVIVTFGIYRRKKYCFSNS